MGQDPIKKKFPINTSVSTLFNLLSKLFNLDIDRLIVKYHSNPKEPFYLIDDKQKDLQFYAVKDEGEIWVDIENVESMDK